LAAALVANADVISDYTVKVSDATPSWHIRACPAWPEGSAVGRPGWGSEGGNFQYWQLDYGSNLVWTANCTYDDVNFTCTLGTESKLQFEAGGGDITGRPAPGYMGGPNAFDDWGAGNQDPLIIGFAWPFTGGMTEINVYFKATDSTGITWTSPVACTEINRTQQHKQPGVNVGCATPVGLIEMLNGGYLGPFGDNMGGSNCYYTAITSVPEALWECIDEHAPGSACWGQPKDGVGWSQISSHSRCIRLCDDTLAMPVAGTWWQASQQNTGLGLWINTVSDSLPGNMPVRNGWRNDCDNMYTGCGPYEPSLLNKSTKEQVAEPDTTRTQLFQVDPIALKPREKDTSTEWFLWYEATYPSWGYGYARKKKRS
jgi:hypothetical protein